MGFEARGQRCCTVTICHRPQVTLHILFFGIISLLTKSCTIILSSNV